jgi:hypothetical protein
MRGIAELRPALGSLRDFYTLQAPPQRVNQIICDLPSHTGMISAPESALGRKFCEFVGTSIGTIGRRWWRAGSDRSETLEFHSVRRDQW